MSAEDPKQAPGSPPPPSQSDAEEAQGATAQPQGAEHSSPEALSSGNFVGAHGGEPASSEAPPLASLAARAPISAPPEPPLNPARKRDRLKGLVLVALTFFGTLGLAGWAKWVNTPVPPEPPGPADKSVVVGFPAAIDAVATLSAARERTPREVLRGISLKGVNADGVVDLASTGAEVKYVFQSRAGEGPQPPRDPEGRVTRPYCGKQVVLVTQEGLQENEDETKFPCSTLGFEPLPEPRCTPKQVWEYAKSQDIPTDKLAHIEYYRSKAGPAWRFRIPGSRHRFSLYGDCERELKGAEEAGSIP